ncbi:HTH domain-containing protein [Paramuribaculum intestinale]|uniref:MarR family transcriptional regulator n=1 Tax=Paramuribaculum intestinale TaxID=2094151 RepID=UPI00341FC29C
MLKSPHITAAEIASEIGITDRAVRKIISALKGKGLVERVGSNKSGYWKVNLK